MRTREIPLRSRKYPGRVAIVDAKDYAAVSSKRWGLMKVRSPGVVDNWYATRKATAEERRDGKPASILMHRELMGVTLRTEEIDHEDGDGLNNTRRNLRHATHSQNQRNRRRFKIGKSSQYRGVCKTTLASGRVMWQANIGVDGVGLMLGRFDVEEDAARAYDDAARHYFRERTGNLNFPKRRRVA